MNLNFNIKKIIEKFSPKRAVSKPRERLVLLHWKIITFSFFVAVVFLFASNFLVYYQINRGDQLSENKIGDNALLSIDKQLVLVVEKFEKKKTAYELLRSTYGVYTDPSK